MPPRKYGRKGGMKVNYALEVQDLLNTLTYIYEDDGVNDVKISHSPALLDVQRILEEHTNPSERKNIKKYYIDKLFNIWNTEGITVKELRDATQSFFDPDLQEFIQASKNLDERQKQDYLNAVSNLLNSPRDLTIPQQIKLGGIMIAIFRLLLLAVVEREGMHMRPPTRVEHPPINPSKNPDGKGKRGGMKKTHASEINYLLKLMSIKVKEIGMDVIIEYISKLPEIQKLLNQNSNESEKANISRFRINEIFNILNTKNITFRDLLNAYAPYITRELYDFVMNSGIEDWQKERFREFTIQLAEGHEEEFLRPEEQHELSPLIIGHINCIILAIIEREPAGKGRRGKAMPSDLNISQQIAKQSYNLTDPQKDIDGWMLADWSPNLKIYTKGNVGILGVRGTKTMEDVSVWPTVTLNTLGSTDLYKRIEKEFMDFKNKHPEITEYYAVGHSLGGALIDVMLRKGIVKEAVSFNPAIQYNDINGGLPNRRIYYGADPMYKLMGWWDRKAEHRDTDMFSKFLSSMVDSPVGNMLSAHKLSNFIGGRKCRKCGLMK